MHIRFGHAALVAAAVGAVLSLSSHLLVAQSTDPIAGSWTLTSPRSPAPGR